MKIAACDLDAPPRLWVIVGATGAGKTLCSLRLAHTLAQHGRPAEVVNADAMQLYRGMHIGTAKLAETERRGIPHHLFDALDITEEASVAWYQPRARTAITAVQARGADAILVGGSGLYVSSVIFDFRFPPRNDALRTELEAQARRHGTALLLNRLRDLDAAAAAAVDARNPRRVVRALEIVLLGGSGHAKLPEQPKLWQPHTRILGAHCERSELVQRIDRRVEHMWHAGLLAEVRTLVPLGLERGKTASRAIGYAQALAQLRGELTQQQAIVHTQVLTRRYARRQQSWFQRYPDVCWSRGAATDAESF